MKTLYISDLDGTLLQPNIQISDYSKKILNELINHGMLFSVATARSIASVTTILQDVTMNLPIILMNGVCIYDWNKKDYIKVETLCKESIQILMSIIKEHHLKGFVYTIKDSVMSTYYEDLSSKALHDFYQERLDLYQKRFTQVENFSQLSNEPIIYFSLLDQKEKLELVFHTINALPDLNCVFYKDTYSIDLWYLEVFSNKASKYHAVQYLRNYLELDSVACFGDNYNDLPLFEASDRKFAVSNAVTELKDKADEVIGSNIEDGVVIWLNEHNCF